MLMLQNFVSLNFKYTYVASTFKNNFLSDTLPLHKGSVKLGLAMQLYLLMRIDAHQMRINAHKLHK